MIEKTTGLSAAEIEELCEGMGSMSENQAVEMVAFIEKRIMEFMENLGK